MLYAELNTEHNTEHLDSYDAETVWARISNPEAENGLTEDLAPPLAWLNSAQITADPDNDEVNCLVSIGDPRGAFCFTVRRLANGRIIIHTPHPDESLAHMKTREVRLGTLEVITDSGAPYICKNDPEYFLTFETDNTVDIYDERSEVIDEDGISKLFIAGYIDLECRTEDEANIQAKLYQHSIDKWEAGEIDVDDIPNIEY